MPAILNETTGEIEEISPWLHNEDLKGKEFTLTIDRLEKPAIALPGRKPEPKEVLYFKDAKKPLVMNTTNLRTCKSLFGTKAADWAGKRIIVFATTCRAKGGGIVGCIRMKGVA